MRVRESAVPATVLVGGTQRPFSGSAIRRFETDVMYDRHGRQILGQDMGDGYVTGDVISSRHYHAAVPGHHITGAVVLHTDGLTVSLYGAGDKPRQLHYRDCGAADIPRIEAELGITFCFE